MAYKKKVTMKDIAEASGVSITAVSMILNRRSDVSFSEETVSKVFSAAENLGYELEKANEKPVKTVTEQYKLSNTIAVFCPNISNAYYSTVIQSIEQAANIKNFKILIMTTFRDKNQEKELITDALNIHVRGIIFTMMPSDPEFLEDAAKKIPVVIIGDKTSSLDSKNMSIIETSNHRAGVLLAEHLYELGHRNIAFISTTLEKTVHLSMRYQRLKGIEDTYRKYLIDGKYNIIVKEAKITPKEERNNLFVEYEVGKRLCQECLKNRKKDKITAFIGVNDMVAYGIMDAILMAGYEIPYDFSVCGFDNDFPSGLLPISLTSVEHYMEDKGKKAFEMLYGKIKNTKASSAGGKYIVRIEYQANLIERDSTGKVI